MKTPFFIILLGFLLTLFSIWLVVNLLLEDGDKYIKDFMSFGAMMFVISGIFWPSSVRGYRQGWDKVFKSVFPWFTSVLLLLVLKFTFELASIEVINPDKQALLRTAGYSGLIGLICGAFTTALLWHRIGYLSVKRYILTAKSHGVSNLHINRELSRGQRRHAFPPGDIFLPED